MCMCRLEVDTAYLLRSLFTSFTQIMVLVDSARITGTSHFCPALGLGVIIPVLMLVGTELMQLSPLLIPVLDYKAPPDGFPQCL